jgi:hypothetical protein
MTDVQIRLMANSGRPGVCRGCHKPIVWMETLNGKRMPMNGEAIPREIRDGVEVYAAGDAHWASCSEREMFDRRSKTNAART